MIETRPRTTLALDRRSTIIQNRPQRPNRNHLAENRQSLEISSAHTGLPSRCPFFPAPAELGCATWSLGASMCTQLQSKSGPPPPHLREIPTRAVLRPLALNKRKPHPPSASVHPHRPVRYKG